MRKSEQHIDFDLDLAVSQSKDNAVYYIQYAHARICRMLEKAASNGIVLNVSTARSHAPRPNLMQKPNCQAGGLPGYCDSCSQCL